MSFSTLGKVPEAITQPATHITSYGATSNGTVSANDLFTTVTFEYGLTTSYGQTLTATQSPVTGNSITNVSVDITGLTAGTTYHFRIKTVNSLGTAYGNDMSFTTTPILLATITTTLPSSITETTAISGGNITDDGGGTITERGVCWGTNANPTIYEEHTTDGSGTGSFTSNMKCLSFAITYYVRAYATNSAETAYGDQLSFPTPGVNPIIFNPNLTYSSVSDIDGNCYKTIQFGNQTWMAENLKTTKYNDNTAILLITDSTQWSNIEVSAGYCWYDNNEAAYKQIYGALYNGYAVSGKLCPVGWHVPKDSEWEYLEIYLWIDRRAANELKEADTTHWHSPNAANNETGFTALTGGYRSYDGTFDLIGYHGFWLSNTAHNSYKI